MIAPYMNRYLIIMIATAVITILQMTYMQITGLVNFLYIWLSQLLGPAFFGGILLIIFWYTGRKLSNKLIFNIYLITWLINLAVVFILLVRGDYNAYLYRP